MKKILIPIFLFALFNLSASTVIVNSLYDSDSDPESPVVAGYIEDGLMDLLFDRGFIMFSTCNTRGYKVEGAGDARYMITIEPHGSESYVSWKLNATVNGMLIDEGEITLDSVKDSGKLDARRVYYLIGQEVGAKVCLFF